jgi:hypothetical protein
MKGRQEVGVVMPLEVKARNRSLSRARRAADSVVGPLPRLLAYKHAIAGVLVYGLAELRVTRKMRMVMLMLNNQMTPRMILWRTLFRKPRRTLSSMRKMMKVMSRSMVKRMMRYYPTMENLTRCASVSK